MDVWVCKCYLSIRITQEGDKKVNKYDLNLFTVITKMDTNC